MNNAALPANFNQVNFHMVNYLQIIIHLIYFELTECHSCSIHPIDDNVIAIVADGGHGADAAETEN
jgi:hypothetical protein